MTRPFKRLSLEEVQGTNDKFSKILNKAKVVLQSIYVKWDTLTCLLRTKEKELANDDCLAHLRFLWEVEQLWAEVTRNIVSLVEIEEQLLSWGEEAITVDKKKTVWKWIEDLASSYIDILSDIENTYDLTRKVAEQVLQQNEDLLSSLIEAASSLKEEEQKLKEYEKLLHSLRKIFIKRLSFTRKDLLLERIDRQITACRQRVPIKTFALK